MCRWQPIWLLLRQCCISSVDILKREMDITPLPKRKWQQFMNKEDEKCGGNDIVMKLFIPVMVLLPLSHDSPQAGENL
jgi:hypothetical protein